MTTGRINQVPTVLYIYTIVVVMVTTTIIFISLSLIHSLYIIPITPLHVCVQRGVIRTHTEKEKRERRERACARAHTCTHTHTHTHASICLSLIFVIIHASNLMMVMTKMREGFLSACMCYVCRVTHVYTHHTHTHNERLSIIYNRQ